MIAFERSEATGHKSSQEVGRRLGSEERGSQYL